MMSKQAEPFHLCCAAVPSCCSPSVCILFQRFAPELPGHGGSPTLSVFHVIQRAATKTKKSAIIVFCHASGAACKRVRNTRYRSWQSGVRDSRLELPQDQTAHPATQTRMALMRAEALVSFAWAPDEWAV